ncbi:hypothetical protein Goshw_002600, partial [Gossypium schwendimanii]|nr:hypothetical protein [Gossypium schwendimanii]
LRLPVDGPVVTGSIVAADWRDVCKQLLGRRSRLTRLGVNCVGDIVLGDVYDFIPNREPIIAQELAYGPKYRPLSKRHGKPYLLSKEVKGRKCYMRRPRRVPKNPRFGEATEARPSFAPMQEETPMAAPPLGQYGSTYSSSFTKPTIFTQAPHIAPYFLVSTPSLISEDDFDDDVYADYVCGTDEKSVFFVITQYTYTPTLVVSQTPLGSLFYQGGPSSQPSPQPSP